MKKYIIIVCIISCIASCKKDYLDRFPQTVVSPQLFFKTQNDLDLYINGLLSLPGSDGIYVNGDDATTDDYGNISTFTLASVMQGTINANNVPNYWSWGRLRNINYFLDNYQTADVSDEIKNHYVGLARLYRAQFYMTMVQRYNNVPWYSHTVDPNDTAALYKPSDPRSLVVDSIMADLDFAATHVNESVPQSTPGLWAAKSYYARYALYEGTYRKYHPELNLESTADTYLQIAKKQADDIITSGKFSLDPNFSNLFNSTDLSGNSEVILNQAYDGSIQGSGAGNNTVNGNQVYGVQFPSRDLMQQFGMSDGSKFTAKPGYDTMQFVSEFKNRDPRLYITYFYPGFAKAVSSGTPQPYVPVLGAGKSGYYQLKGYINNTDGLAIANVDVPIIRYAEILLIYAEASAELGTLTQADIDNTIGLIRSRAGLTNPALNMAAANASPDPLLAAKYPKVSGANKGIILEIRREKRVEFALEGQRYDDLFRWAAGPTAIAPYPEGLYFEGLGKYDLTGDGVPDIQLLDESTPIPSPGENNSLGVPLIYYQVSSFGNNSNVWLKNGHSGATVTGGNPRTFTEPQDYYLPIPASEIALNPNLEQVFGW
jgi:hypothetical protein